MASPAVNVNITSKDEQVLASLRKLQREFKELDGAIDKPRRSAGSLGDTIRDNLGLAAFGGALFYANREAEEAAASLRSTQAVIESTGNAAQVSAEQQMKLVDELSKLGGVDDEIVNAGANMLRTFTEIKDDNFGLALASALDISAMKGQDLATVAEQIGKALNDPVAGMGKLAKQGVVLSEVQKQQVRDFAAVGDIASAQKVILQELEKEYGGQAEAAATASGRMRVAFDNAAESIGTSIAPAVEDLATVVTVVAGAFEDLPGPVQTGMVGLGAVAVIAPRVADTVSKVTDLTRQLGESMSNAGNKAKDAANNLIVPKSAVEGLGSAADTTTQKTDAMSGSMGKVGTAAAAATAGLAAYSATTALLNNMSDPGINVANLAADLEAFADGTKPFEDSLEEIAGGTDGLAEAFRKADYTAGDMLKGNLSGGLFGDTSIEAKEAQRTLDEVDKALAQLATTNAPKAREAFAGISEELRAQGYSQAEINAVFVNYGDALDDATNKANAAAQTGETVAASQEAVRTSLDLTTQRWRDQANAVKETNDETERSIDISLGRLSASTGYGDAVANVTDAKKALDEARASGDPAAVAEAERNLTTAIARQAEAAVKLYEANAELNGTTVDGAAKTAILRQEMDKARESTGYWNGDLQTTRDQLTWIGQEHVGKVTLDVEEAKRAMQDVIGLQLYSAWLAGGGAASGQRRPGTPEGLPYGTTGTVGPPSKPRRSNLKAGNTSGSGPFESASGVTLVVDTINVGGVKGMADLQAHLSNLDRRNGRRIGWGAAA